MVTLPFPVARLVVGGGQARAGRPAGAYPGQCATCPGAAAGAGTPASDFVAETEITLISPTELYFLGRKARLHEPDPAGGRWPLPGQGHHRDGGSRRAAVHPLPIFPSEREVTVLASQDTIVLQGTATDALRLDQILTLAYAHAGDSKRVVNLMAVGAPQQVMLEVTIAEVGKNVLDNLDIDFTRMPRRPTGACRGSSRDLRRRRRGPGPVQPEPSRAAPSRTAPRG